MNSPHVLHKKQQKLTRLIEKGKLKEAIKPLTQLCKQQPDNINNWLTLASLYGQTGDFQSVIKVCQQLESQLKDNATLYSLMGNAYASLSRTKEAHEYYKKALNIQPNDPGLLNNLGNALYLDNKLEEAADIFLKVVAIKPNYADAHNNLGNIYKALNDNELAVKHYKYAVQLNHDLSKTYLNLGHIYADRIGRPELAEESFRKAHKIEPDNLEALSGITNMLRFQGRMNEALELIKQVQQNHQSDSGLIAAEADIYERTGKHEKAYELTKNYLHDDIKTIHPMVIDVLMRICLKHNCCDEVISMAKTMIKSPRMTLPFQQNTHFGLGKLYDKLEKYDDAFNHYKVANETIDIPFDKEKFKHRINNLIKAYSLNNIKNSQKSNIDTSAPIFIVGMPRSGTSLTEQILSSHPEVGGAGELNDLNNITSSLSETLDSKQPYPACIVDLSIASANSIAQNYLTTIKNICVDKLRITDKMPHNFLNLGLIFLLFPQAKIIHCVRDPRDTCLSIFFQNFGWLHPYGTRLDWLGFYYKQYQRVMNHWEFEIKMPIHSVSYDDMVNNQEATSRKLLEFCELEWDDACLDFHKSNRVVATASYDQVRQKIYTKSQQRWKKYEKNICPLVENLGQTLDEWPG